MMTYRHAARTAIPIRADCHQCDLTWTGPTSRAEALAHRETTDHAIWVECKPKEAVVVDHNDCCD